MKYIVTFDDFVFAEVDADNPEEAKEKAIPEFKSYGFAEGFDEPMLEVEEINATV